MIIAPMHIGSLSLANMLSPWWGSSSTPARHRYVKGCLREVSMPNGPLHSPPSSRKTKASCDKLATQACGSHVWDMCKVRQAASQHLLRSTRQPERQHMPVLVYQQRTDMDGMRHQGFRRLCDKLSDCLSPVVGAQEKMGEAPEFESRKVSLRPRTLFELLNSRTANGYGLKIRLTAAATNGSHQSLRIAWSPSALHMHDWGTY